METKQSNETISGKKDRSIPFLVGAAIVFIIGAIIYKSVVSPMLIKMDLYQQAVSLYECGEYTDANKLFLRLGDYKDSQERYWASNLGHVKELINNSELDKAKKQLGKIQEEIEKNNSGDNENVKKCKQELEKVIYLAELEESGEDMETSQILYHDMDGDGSLECCLMQSDGLKEYYTIKNGEIIKLDSGDTSSYVYIISRLFEKHNVILVMKLDEYGEYTENFYQLKDTGFECVAQSSMGYEIDSEYDITACVDNMRTLEHEKSYKVNQFGNRSTDKEYEIYEGEVWIEKTVLEYEEYINNIIGNETSSDGVNEKLQDWEIETEIGQRNFSGETAYYVNDVIVRIRSNTLDKTEDDEEAFQAFWDAIGNYDSEEEDYGYDEDYYYDDEDYYYDDEDY